MIVLPFPYSCLFHLNMSPLPGQYYFHTDNCPAGYPHSPRSAIFKIQKDLEAISYYDFFLIVSCSWIPMSCNDMRILGTMQRCQAETMQQTHNGTEMWEEMQS